MSKTPPPDPKVTKDSGKAAALNKALADKKAKDGDGKKKVFDPRRDPNSYSQQELVDMIQGGEITPIHHYGKLLGFTDLDGDKKLEIVVEDGFYEGAGQLVYRVEDTQIVKLGGTGCGA